MRPIRTLSILAALLCGSVAPAASQAPGPTLLRAAAARVRAQMQGVQNYTLVMSLLGETMTLYAARGRPGGPFRLQYAATGERSASLAVAVGMLDQVRLQAMQNADGVANVAYNGIGAETGAPAYRLLIADPGDSLAPPAVRAITLHVDTATKAVRRVAVALGRSGPVTTPPADVAVDLSDWRSVGGMMVPYHRHLVGHGMRGSGAATIQQEIDRARQQLVTATGLRRTELRRVIDMLQGVLQRDEMVLDVDVVSATVNAGAPEGVPLQPLGP